MYEKPSHRRHNSENGNALISLSTLPLLAKHALKLQVLSYLTKIRSALLKISCVFVFLSHLEDSTVKRRVSF